MPVNLSGLQILNTRPSHQAISLQQAIEAAGGVSINLPLLAIEAADDSPELHALPGTLSMSHMAIFVSPNAVEYGFRHLPHVPTDLQLAAVGQSTARILRETSQRTDIICPENVFNSEALLSLPAMQAVTGKRILIFRAQQGRELLAETLRQRGAEVVYIPVYQRRMPTENTAALQQQIKQQGIDLIIITSGEALHNLLQMAGQDLKDKVQQLQILVVTPRLAELAQSCGFSKPAIISDNATDDAIINAIKYQYEPAGANESP